MTGMIKVMPIILCGGSGTRLWPLSRAGFPKQFLCLTGKESLFQDAAKRLMALSCEHVDVGAPLIVTNEEHRFLALEQLREIGVEPGAALLEPEGRNTAPALTLAALAAMENGEDPVLVVTPADQTVADAGAFNGAMHDAISQVAEGAIVILGVTPDRPETGYGYIQAAVGSTPTLVVERFVEKPDEATARQYLAEGNYYWNAGMFVLKASVWLQAIESFRPDIAATTRAAWVRRSTDAAFVRPGAAEFAAIPSDSIDYAVMERCPGSRFPIRMAPLDAGWSDLGAWDTVWSVLPKDEQGNAHVGDVLATDSSNTLVHATSRLVAVVGVENLVVVETPDAVLVSDRSRSQDVKHIVNALQQQKREEHTLHRKVHRPWGWYDSIDEGGRFKVKRIQVKPGASLSLQKHHHRAEHWVIVSGTAEITNGSKVLLLTENQSTYIPLGEVHRLANPGTIPLEIIEVQSGSYRSIMPTNLYGPGDNYHPENSHVIPALIRRFHEAKVNQAPHVTIWGTGNPQREFLYVDDMAAASVHVMNISKATYEQHTQPMLSHINVGYGEDVTILKLAQTVARTVGYTGPIHTDPAKPDGTPRKLMDSSRLSALGWKAQMGLESGLKAAYEDFLYKFATRG